MHIASSFGIVLRLAAEASMRAFDKMESNTRVLGSTANLINQGKGDGSTYESNHGRDALIVVLISSFIVLGGVALTILLLIHPRIETNFEYGVVVDAGSSHTSAYVYKWPGNTRLRGTAAPVDEIWNAENYTGISSFVDNPSAAGLLVTMLMKNVTEHIPHDKMHITPVYLGATAGMRLLHEVNKTISDKIMVSVTKALSKSGFNFSSSNANIISGKDEGLFGWITVNYLKKDLQEKQKEYVQRSLGALDLGGASTQITFVPKNTSQATHHLKLYGQDYPVYTKSYLCYGLNEVHRRFLAQLAKNANYSTTILNPCARKGLIFNQSASSIFRRPCSCLPSVSTRTQFTFKGVSNASECSKNVQKLFDFRSVCPNAEPFSNETQPPVKGTFHAFSAFSYVAKSLNVSRNHTREEFKSAYLSYCSKKSVEINNVHPLVDNRICFAGHYIYFLLTDGYGFNDDTWKIVFKATVDNKSVGWALGYMINATNLIPLNEPVHARIKDQVLIPAIVVCGICILIGVMLCVTYSWRRKPCRTSNRSGYDEI